MSPSVETRQQRICAVIPVKNESATIGKVIDETRAKIEAAGHIVAAIVVTDDSIDSSPKIARAHGAAVVGGEGKGLGFAMWKGLKASLKYTPEIIIAIDADGQADLSEVDRFLEPILKDEADLVLGSRFLDPGLVQYRYPFVNRLGVRILVRILRGITKLPLTDSHGGLRAMRFEVARDLEMIGTFTYVQETIIDAREKGFRIVEIPSAWKKREVGSSRVVSSIALYVCYTLPVLILRAGHHIKLLYPLGLFCMFLSFVHLTTVAIQTGFHLHVLFDRQTFHLFFLLLSVGANLFFFGLTLELVSGMSRRLRKIEP